MIKVKVDIDYDKIKKEAANEIEEAVSETAKAVLADAKGRIHNVTGNLAASGKVVEWKKEGKAIGAYVKFGFTSSCDYALHVEKGGPVHPYGNKKVIRYRKAKPFLRPAMNSKRGEFKIKMKAAVGGK